MGILRLGGHGGLSGSSVMHLGAGGALEIGYSGESPWALNDEYTVDLPAGSVHGTLATDGVNTRVLADTESKISISGGKLVYAGGRASAAYGDPLTNYTLPNPYLYRTHGRIWSWDFSIPDATKEIIVGGARTAAYLTNDAGWTLAGASLYARSGNGARFWSATPTGSQKYFLVYRALGSFGFIQAVGGHIKLNFISRHDLSAATFVTKKPIMCLNNKSGLPQFDYSRATKRTWLPSPVASDSFYRADGALGSTDGQGQIESGEGMPGDGGSGGAWTAQVGTWGVSTLKATASDVAGAAGIATVDAGTPDVAVIVKTTHSAGNIGVVVRYVDEDNFVYAIYTGTQATLRKVVGGTDSQVIAPVTIAYAAGAQIVLIANGTSFVLKYNDADTNTATATISDAALQTSTLCGLYTTDAGNTFTDFVCYALGSEGQYDNVMQGRSWPFSFSDDFNRANGALGFNSQRYRWVAGVGTTTITIVDGAAVTTATGTDYMLIDLPQKPATMGCTVRWTGDNATAGQAATMACAANSQLSAVRAEDTLHFELAPTGWTLSLRELAGSFVQLGTGSFSPKLTSNTSWSWSWSFSGNTVTLNLPDGTTQSFTDSRISYLTGPYVFWEITGSDAAQLHPAYESVHASG